MRPQYGRMCYSGLDITIDEFLNACVNGEYERIKCLLDQGLNPNIGRHRPLMFAVMRGNVGVMQSLLELGIVNYADAVGRTALHFAARAGNWDMVALLIDAGADTGLVDHEGYTALDHAVAAVHTEIVEFLEVAVTNAGSK
ncbi:ankyrin repeat domain-containing protein [Aspergillus undulatus]|uniref:ankyrin repeat domain-containing protein n=1 Tax=Aspergillus undulatus TaxID=1810928 RepID=UPI003CCD3033